MKSAMFFENARLLYGRFGIVPLLYGSLGLEYITGENLNSDDIDILIPSVFISEKWEDFKSALTEAGYVLVDEHEHAFQKDGIHYAYASLEELGPFAQIDLSDIECRNVGGVPFKVLSLQQYLAVYTASSKDGYRINVRQKKDGDKILFIQKRLM